jgi:hypothetical protein
MNFVQVHRCHLQYIRFLWLLRVLACLFLHHFTCQQTFLLSVRLHSHSNFGPRILINVVSSSIISLKLQTVLQLIPHLFHGHAMYSLQLISTISYSLSLNSPTILLHSDQFTPTGRLAPQIPNFILTYTYYMRRVRVQLLHVYVYIGCSA